MGDNSQGGRFTPTQGILGTTLPARSEDFWVVTVLHPLVFYTRHCGGSRWHKADDSPQDVRELHCKVGHNGQVPATLLAHTDTPAHHERRQLGSACPKVKHSPLIDALVGWNSAWLRQWFPSPSEAAAWQGSWGTGGSWMVNAPASFTCLAQSLSTAASAACL